MVIGRLAEAKALDKPNRNDKDVWLDHACICVYWIMYHLRVRVSVQKQKWIELMNRKETEKVAPRTEFHRCNEWFGRRMDLLFLWIVLCSLLLLFFFSSLHVYVVAVWEQ